MTNYNSTANYIFNLVVQVLVTAYLTREMLLYGRVGWAVALILVNLAAIGINLYIWLNVKKGRFSAQKIKQGRLTILVILLVSLLCLAVVSRTARVSPENPTVSAAIGQIVPQSDKTKCISVKRKGNTTFAEAEKAGLTYTIDEIKLRDAHPNTAVIEAKSADGRTLTMQASSIGGGRIMVNKLDGIDVNFNGMFNTLVIRNQDASGTVAAITSILSQLRVNVANMSLYRHKRGGDALMVIELDQHLKPSQVAFLSELPGVLSMTYYDKEEDDDGSGFDEGNI